MSQKKEQLEEIFSYYNSIRKPVQQEDVVNMLREIQELYGFISPEMKQRIADTLEIKESVLTCLIKRFSGLKEADYQHIVTVCSGERCGKKNGNSILQAVMKELQISEKCRPGTPMLSKNGKVLLKTQNCLKQCRTAPNLMVDGKLYSGVRAEDVPALLSFKAKS